MFRKKSKLIEYSWKRKNYKLQAIYDVDGLNDTNQETICNSNRLSIQTAFNAKIETLDREIETSAQKANNDRDILIKVNS